MATTEAICPDGDVVLVCKPGTEDELRLRCSSTVLSLGSPVFKVMLGQRFKEGNELAKSGFVEVPLLDDEPGPLRTLCNVLHLRNSSVTTTNLNVEDMIRVAKLSDKYDCAEAMKPSSLCWLLLRAKFKSNDDRRGMLAAAYYLRSEEAFAQLSRSLLLDGGSLSQTSPLLHLDDSDNDVLRRIIGKTAQTRDHTSFANVTTKSLDAERLRVQREVLQFVEAQIQKPLDFRKKVVAFYCASTCTFTEGLTAQLILQLRIVQLWPSPKVLDQTVSETLRRMRMVADLSDSGIGACRGSNQFSRCVKESRQAPLGMSVAFSRKADELEKSVVGACLGCFMEKGVMCAAKCEHAAEKSSYWRTING